MHWAAVIAIWCLTLQRMKNYLATVTVIKSASTKTKMTTEGNCQQETDWLPVAGMTAQSKEIVVKTLDRLLLQHVVDSVATVQLADQILFIERRLCYRRHCTVHIRHFTPSCEVVCFVARCVWMFVNTIAWTILGVTVKSVWVYGQNMVSIWSKAQISSKMAAFWYIVVSRWWLTNTGQLFIAADGENMSSHV